MKKLVYIVMYVDIYIGYDIRVVKCFSSCYKANAFCDEMNKNYENTREYSVITMELE